jgi:hypothetical protein
MRRDDVRFLQGRIHPAHCALFDVSLAAQP